MNRDNTNSGALFKNDKKEKDTHPDYTGTIRIAGQDFWLSAWIKKGNKGSFMSLATKPKEERPQGRSTGPIENIDSDIPFN